MPLDQREKLDSSVWRNSSEFLDLSLLLTRLELLAEPERTWLEMYWFKNCSARDLALMQGVSTNAMRIRIKLLTQRVLGRAYIRFVRGEKHFSQMQMAMAYDIYILGIGYRTIARKHGLSQWSVRKTLRQFRRWLKQQNP